MRVISFSKYDPTDVPLPVHVRGWQLLWMAVNNYPAGSKEQTLVGNRTFQELRDASESVKEKGPNGQMNEIGRRLKPEGYEAYFQDDEWRVLTAAVDKFRENILIGGSEALLWIDNLLEKAPVVSRKDYIAKVKKIKLEPAEVES